MNDISVTIVPKSDQLNADDLIAGTMTLKITGVRLTDGDQPVSVDYEGGEGRPFKPCKSMRRALIKAWGKDGDVYVGRSIIVYNDPTVKWAGKEEGGIRISHMSHIKEKIRMMLTVSRGKRSPFNIEPIAEPKTNPLSDSALKEWGDKLDDSKTMDELSMVGASIAEAGYDEAGSKSLTELYRLASKRIREV